MPPVLNQKNQKGKGSKKPEAPKAMNLAMTGLLGLMFLVAIYSIISPKLSDIPNISLSQVVKDIPAGLVKKIDILGDKLTITYNDDSVKKSKKETEVSLSDTFKNYGVTFENLNTIEIAVENESGFGFWMLNIIPFLIPVIFIVVFFWFISRQVKGAGMQAFSFGQSKARIIDPADRKQKVTFKDVAGVKEAKEELKEIVDFLKNPKKFIDIGAKIPKGVLLMGPAGTGKTLLARAVAGEAIVPFFYLSGSEFVEMFVGVGASRVRDLFQMAKKSSPAIIFIDEIDAVGRVRGIGLGGGNDEREQTLNQILVEMDGFEPNEKVIVMAATNRPDVLDPALIRPGRFDRRVMLDLPDRNDREAILKIHSTTKPFAEDVNLRVIAERTPGFSGADLYSLMNEGAILAAREERKKVSQFDLIRSIEKVMLGPERKSHLFSKKEKEITAYHEAGHALLSSILPNADPVHKVSIVARGHAGGYTLKLPFEDRKLQSRGEFLDDIVVSLGGYVAEEMIFGDVTTGPSSDLQVASALARNMVTKYGMSSQLGPIAFERLVGSPIMGHGVEGKEYSEEVSAKIDKEISKIINDGMARAKIILTKNKKVLDTIAKKLVEVETLEREEYEKVIIACGIILKKPQEEK